MLGNLVCRKFAFQSKKVMQHEILYLNENRVYVRVGDTWYDTNKEFDPKVGAPFLLGKISEVLTFDDYISLYPGSTKEIFQTVNDSVNMDGSIRAAINKRVSRFSWVKMVKYGITKQPRKDINSNDSSQE